MNSPQPSGTPPATSPTTFRLDDTERARLRAAAAEAQSRVGIRPEGSGSIRDATADLRRRFEFPPETPEQAAAREARAAKDREREAKQRAAARRDRWLSMERCIGRRYADCSLENFDVTDERQRPVVERLMRYQDDIRENVRGGVNLLLLGPPGTGKDHLLVGLMRTAIVEHGMRVEWVNGMDWFGRVRDSMDSGESEKHVLGELVAPDVLVLSDPVPPLGELTDFQRIMLYRVIDGRYRNMRPTWVTANMLGREDAENRLGPQTNDRLRDGGIVMWCGWTSHRAVGETLK